MRLVLGLRRSDVLAGIERRKVAANDLVRLVPLQTLGAEVPRHNEASNVEHQDRVILNVSHQYATHILLPTLTCQEHAAWSTTVCRYVAQRLPALWSRPLHHPLFVLSGILRSHTLGPSRP